MQKKTQPELPSLMAGRVRTLMTEITPIPAATVTLLRDAADGIEVLMMQRNLNSGFVPGAYVFPGGALDACDGTAEMQALCSGVSDAQASRALEMDRGGLAYWAAAIRESFEEAGLLIAYDVAPHMIEFAAANVAERFNKHRDALNRGANNLAEILRGERLMLAADQLVYFSHWITPAWAPRRYDTRFFAAAAPPAQVALHDNHEIIAHAWIRPAKALDRYRQAGFEMRLPTVRTLEAFAAYDTSDSLLRAMRAQDHVPAILPRMTKEGKRLLPGEPGYEDLITQEIPRAWKT